MRKLMITLVAAAATTAGIAAGLQASARASTNGDGRLQATFTSSAVSVTPKLGMVELIITGTGTVRGFGAATEVVGVVEDRAVSPCGAGGASHSAQRRIVMKGGVLALHEAGMTCITASGPQARAAYRVDGQASTGIFAGARGTGHVTVNVTTGHETLSGTLILASVSHPTAASPHANAPNREERRRVRERLVLPATVHRLRQAWACALTPPASPAA